MEPKISVIVPIYKVENYLNQCVQSILSQTYRNLEIILVDDGSPDQCGKMCDNYKKMDSRIQVIHKLNGGLSDARNAGIDIATGKYLTFVDSDDYISNNMIERLYEEISASDSDIAMCFHCVFLEEENKIRYFESDSRADQNMANTGTEKFEMIEDLWEAWGKLYKKSLFSELRYPKGKLYEDFSLTPKLAYHSNRIVFINEPLYIYRIRNDSIMTGGKRRYKSGFGGSG